MAVMSIKHVLAGRGGGGGGVIRRLCYYYHIVLRVQERQDRHIMEW